MTEPLSTTGQCAARASPKVRRDVSTVAASRRAAGRGRHHDGPWHADRGALTPEQRHGAVDVVGARDDEDCSVSGPETGAQVADEVGVAGVSMRSSVTGPDLNEAAARVVVRNVLARAGSLTWHARRDERLEECGLSGPAGSDEHDVADVLRRGGVEGRRKV